MGGPFRSCRGEPSFSFAILRPMDYSSVTKMLHSGEDVKRSGVLALERELLALEQVDTHVGNLKYPRGCFSISTWACSISSEVSFDSSEVSFHSSEEFFIPHVEISKYPRGNHFSPTQCRFDMQSALNYCNSQQTQRTSSD